MRPTHAMPVLLMLGLLSLSALAQDGQPALPDPDAEIAAGDLVEVNIFELLQPGHDYDEVRRVTPEGDIRVPNLGEVKAADLTARELRQRVEERLASDGITQDPQVRIALRRQADQLAEPAGPLKPGDTVRVRVFELQQPGVDWSQSLAVSEEGTLNVPSLGAVKVEGLDVHEVEDRLVEQLNQQGLVRDAQVRVVRDNDTILAQFSAQHP